MRGEVGLHRRCNPGEGDSPRVNLSTIFAEPAPHPSPLPVRTGRGRRPTESRAAESASGCP
ncbi:MAG: hypothetical protein EKK33_32490 [Bradyrhizobiaceae bacterium]|nr:MAG: hypothetical protein EKK33_32490 [Bradyrhizobiaceae bacterium]